MSTSVRTWARRVSVWWVGWILSGALYLLLIDIADLPELLVGAGAATLAATGFVLAREQYIAAETFRLGWFASLYRPFIKVPTDVAVVSWVALAQLAESFGSFAPNTIIIGVDHERELLLGHQLRRSGGSDAPARRVSADHDVLW